MVGRRREGKSRVAVWWASNPSVLDPCPDFTHVPRFKKVRGAGERQGWLKWREKELAVFIVFL